ncbi:MAG TPA: hypothetical protein VJN67_15160 [Stellaceae bacterium]|nr:hypothetical protein [Stellaceae bacterium]
MMHPKLVSTSIAHRLLDGLFAALWACVIAMTAFAIYILSPFGARDRDAARERMSAEIKMESRDFCEKFGMPVGTDQHLQCVLELDKIRANQDQRTLSVDLP